MNTGRAVFSQIMDYLPLPEFRKCVKRYGGNYKVQKFSCLNQFICMAFAQLTYRDSLRDTETCLRAMQPKLYHVGIRGKVARSTLADANEKRDWRIFADFAHVLIRTARSLYSEDDFGLQLEQAAYVLDSTTIDLCLALFPWAKFRKHKGAIKLHTLLDLRGNIPFFICIKGKLHDVNIFDKLVLEPGAFYIVDRAYTDFSRLYIFVENMAFFIIRAKSNLDYKLLSYRQVDKTTGLRCDQTIKLKGEKTSKQYPVPLRRISYYDTENKKRLVFLTNNFTTSGLDNCATLQVSLES